MPEEYWIVIFDEAFAAIAELIDCVHRIAEDIQNSWSKMGEDLKNAVQLFEQAISEAVAEEDKEAGKRKQFRTITSIFFRANQVDIRLDLLPWYTTGFL